MYVTVHGDIDVSTTVVFSSYFQHLFPPGYLPADVDIKAGVPGCRKDCS